MSEKTRSGTADRPPFPTRENPPKPDTDKKSQKPVSEEVLDEAIEETFPASDPISVDTRKPQEDK